MNKIIGTDNLDVVADQNQPSAALGQVLRSAAKLQELVPDAVLVGGSAAALYAHHRDSFDHDHVVADLAQRYEQVLDAVEASDGWATSVRASRPPMTILGSLDGVEAGLRQMRRTRPLETAEFELDAETRLVVPTAPEMLRVKAYLIVQRNFVRDYLDVVALSDAIGIEEAVAVLKEIDDYYDDRSGEHGSVLTALVASLADPHPRDTDVIPELPRYKSLAPRWHEWSAVVEYCQDLALRLAGVR
jgi:hypothetical protein